MPKDIIGKSISKATNFLISRRRIDNEESISKYDSLPFKDKNKLLLILMAI